MWAMAAIYRVLAWAQSRRNAQEAIVVPWTEWKWFTATGRSRSIQTCKMLKCDLCAIQCLKGKCLSHTASKKNHTKVESFLETPLPEVTGILQRFQTVSKKHEAIKYQLVCSAQIAISWGKCNIKIYASRTSSHCYSKHFW